MALLWLKGFACLSPLSVVCLSRFGTTSSGTIIRPDKTLIFSRCCSHADTQAVVLLSDQARLSYSLDVVLTLTLSCGEVVLEARGASAFIHARRVDTLSRLLTAARVQHTFIYICRGKRHTQTKGRVNCMHKIPNEHEVNKNTNYVFHGWQKQLVYANKSRWLESIRHLWGFPNKVA